MFDLENAREQMIDCQIRTGDVTDPKVLRAFRKVSKEAFVPKSQKALAYSDTNIITDEGRVILKPRDMAKLIQAADVQPTDVVLDIACGRGYSTAILACLAETVIALEDNDEQVEKATQNLTEARADNAVVVKGDIKAGAREHAPFNVIFVNGSVQSVPSNWLDQLADAGRLVAIVQNGSVGHGTVFSKNGTQIGDKVIFDANAPSLGVVERSVEFVF